jgi:hypothetical protein
MLDPKKVISKQTRTMLAEAQYNDPRNKLNFAQDRKLMFLNHETIVHYRLVRCPLDFPFDFRTKQHNSFSLIYGQETSPSITKCKPFIIYSSD